MGKSDIRRMRELQQGTKENKFSADVIYQKLYLIYNKIPFLKRYVKKLRRKIEIISIEDEYITRRQTSKVITNSLLVIIPLTLAVFFFTKGNALLRVILLMFEVFLIETIMTGMVDKLDTKLLKQQIDFFAEIRHAYHEFNMVEEAIYEVSQNDELEVSRQGEKIYEILISDDPETELEKYYDVAPNSYLKEFAGISYLTREFGDRTIDGASLYLKNLNNITQEMQLEILKRDKLDYVFQSLSVIAMLPVLFLQPLRNWAVSNFSFTAQFYDGKLGLIAQIALIILTLICYILTRKLKDSGAIKDEYKDPNNVWQMKLYRNPIIKKIVDLFIPKEKTKEYRKMIKLMKESATKQKLETVYVNRLTICVVTFICSLLLFMQLHNVAVDYVYNEPTSDYNIMGSMSEADQKDAMEVTEAQNIVLDKFKGKRNTTDTQIEREVRNLKLYQEATDQEIQKATEQIQDKLKIINAEYLKWFEILLAFLFAGIGYMGPKLMLIFQKILRQLEIENEIMQFQTIILMLMKIERVNVEIILEWLERYANIFKEPITKCVNNYEAGAWEALEELKEEVAAPQFIRIVESLQAAVEKIPISQAFDELDNEREYYQEKRKETNEKLISRKGLIGKVVGFAPMVCLFVGYLIVPLVVIGFMSMTEAFSTMSTSI
ncbi:MAG: hypothetical protein ACI4UX_00050 [Clostridia bacterium]